MEILEGILSRRSIRKFRNEPVTEEQVTKLLRAAMSAPSAGNQQPWHFIVIKERAILDAIPRFHQYSSMLHEAPLAVVICGDLAKQKYEGYWVQDCSAATENLLLAAHGMGLGAVWLGIYPRESRVKGLTELLEIPEGIIPLCVIALGYPAEEKEPADRYNESRIHWNRW